MTFLFNDKGLNDHIKVTLTIVIYQSDRFKLGSARWIGDHDGTLTVQKARQFLRDRSGATSIEYAMIGATIALAVVAGATVIGTKLNGYLTQVSSGLN